MTIENIPEQPRVHHYRLYATHGHLVIRNVRSKMIALGVVHEEAGRLNYRFDAGGLAGNHFDTTEKLLQDVAAKLAFAYLDDQFTSLPDCTAELCEGAEQDPYLDITLEDVTPHQGDVGAENPPHIF